MRSLKVSRLKNQLSNMQFVLQQYEMDFEKARKKLLYHHDGDSFFVYSAFFALLWLWVLHKLDVPLLQQLYSQQLSGEIQLFALGMGLISLITLGCFSVLAIAAIIMLINKTFLSYFVWLLYPTFARQAKKILRFDFSNESELARLFFELEEKKQTYDTVKSKYESAKQEFEQRVKTFINSCEDEEVREELNQLFLNKQKIKE